MPTKPPTRCTAPRCIRVATINGRCAEHRKVLPFGRKPGAPNPYTAEYRRNRATLLGDDPQAYLQWVATYEDDGKFCWREGIAP